VKREIDVGRRELVLVVEELSGEELEKKRRR